MNYKEDEMLEATILAKAVIFVMLLIIAVLFINKPEPKNIPVANQCKCK